MSEQAAPSEWELERFGEHLVGPVRAAVWRALEAAHRRAVAGHEGLGLESNDAYGLKWLIHNEELAKALREVTEVRTPKPKGARYSLTVISENNLILYPWKFSDNAYSPLESAKMNLSEVRKKLLALSPKTPDQLALEHAEMTEEEIEAQFQEMQSFVQDAAAAGRLIVLAYASNPHAGVLRAYWGEASQADESGRLDWSRVEEIPRVDGTGGQEMPATPARPLSPVPGPDTNIGTAARFDQAPLGEIVLSPRNPAVSPDGGQPTPPPHEAGSDD